jgi:hypothetical protein
MTALKYGIIPNLDDLPDIDVSGALNGQTLQYNSSTQTWEAGNVVGGGIEYVAITGTTDEGGDLTKNRVTGPFTYNLANFSGVGYAADRVVMLVIQFENLTNVNNSDETFYSLPGEVAANNMVMVDHNPRDGSSWNAPLTIPVVDSIILRMNLNGSQTNRFTILGAIQNSESTFINEVGGAGASRYVAISGTTGPTAISQSKDGTGGVGTDTYNYNLADLTGGEFLDSTLINGVWVQCIVGVNGNTSAAKNAIIGTFPDGTDHDILAAETDTASGFEDDDQHTYSTKFIPVNIGQTTLTLKLQIGTTHGGADERVEYTIIGVQQPLSVSFNTDYKYVGITGTSGTALSQSSNTSAGPYNYDITDFIGGGYSPGKVRGVYIEWQTHTAINDEMQLTATYPDGTTRDLGYTEGADTQNGNGTVSLLPINPGTSTFDLEFIYTSGNAGNSSNFTIIGVQQVELAGTSRGLRSDSSDPTVISLTDDVVLVDTTGGDKTVELPQITAPVHGKVITIKNVGTGGNNAVITADTTNPDMVEAVGSFVTAATDNLVDGNSAEYIADSNTNTWWLI